eukprot:2546471-Prymnesium_polylepis.1
MFGFAFGLPVVTSHLCAGHRDRTSCSWSWHVHVSQFGLWICEHGSPGSGSGAVRCIKIYVRFGSTYDEHIVRATALA